ncbi:uncharacterized protein LOC129588432 [Paramacrobiotus metropolitanus]|uniref:uncharacterized protein LOC129588432 n=1 Tax=Paramacrobiotus metropolitanus TaxID=2943436 RepID=UPI002445CF71|nr:uncharacterized protein LOC129588432 [Paramacrobiotus metropolitanus]
MGFLQLELTLGMKWRLLLSLVLIAITVLGLLLFVHIINYNFRTTAPLPDYMDDFITADNGDIPSALHLTRFYNKAPVKPTGNLCWLECVSLLSMLLYIKPNHVYVHTNYPDFWPFDSCYSLIATNWTNFKMIHRRRRFVIGGNAINPNNDEFIAHEADITKLTVLHECGGIVSDLDVFYLPNIQKLLSRFRDGFDCIASRELIRDVYKMNLGFLACHKNSPYVRAVLQNYKEDYKTNDWVYNSGEHPWNLYSANPLFRKTVYVDDQISNHPSWTNVKTFLNKKSGMPWKHKPAFHSFFHDCTYNLANVHKQDTSFALMISFILTDAIKIHYDLTRGKPELNLAVG